MNAGNQGVHTHWPSTSELRSPQILPHTTILPGSGLGIPASSSSLPGLNDCNIDGASANMNRIAFPSHGFYVYHPPYYSYSSELLKMPKGTRPQSNLKGNGPHHEHQGSTQSASAKSGSSSGNNGALPPNSRGSRQSNNQQSKSDNRRDIGDPFQNRQSSGSTGSGNQARETNRKDPFQNRHPGDGTRKASTSSGDPFQNKHSQDSDRKINETSSSGDPFKNRHVAGGMRSSSGDPFRNTSSSGAGKGSDPFQAQHGKNYKDSKSQDHRNNDSGNSTRDRNGTHGRQSERDWRQEAVTDSVQW